LMVTIYGKTLKVHRMVAKLFLREPTKEETVNHKNGIKTDNRASNLEWMSFGDNNRHAFASGLMTEGAKVHTAVLCDEDVAKIKTLFVEYKLGDTEIGELFGVNNSTISNIRRGISWKRVLPELTFERKSPFGRGVGKKLCGEDIPKIRAAYKFGRSKKEIGEMFGVHSATIGGIIKGTTWKNY